MVINKPDRLPFNVSVRLGETLSAVSGLLEISGEICAKIEYEIATVLSRLGIPGHPVAEVTVAADPLNDVLLQIYIDQRLCMFPPGIVRQAYGYLTGSPQIVAELDAVLDSQTAAKLISLVCAEAVKLQPGLLLTYPQARRYCEELELDPAGPPDFEQMHSVLLHAVSLGHSLGDREAVRQALSQHASDNHSRHEALIAALKIPKIEIHLDPAYLRQLTVDYEESAAQSFPSLRKTMYTSLGVVLPDFCLVADASLAPGTFAFKINDLLTLPQVGIPAGKILVNADDGQLREQGIDAIPTFSEPIIMLPASLVDSSMKDEIAAANIYIWDQMQFVVFSLLNLLTDRCYQLIDLIVVDRMISQLGQSLPELERAARRSLSIDSITSLLRELLVSKLSIQNLAGILQIMLDSLSNPMAAAPGELLNIVRTGLREEIVDKITQPYPTLTAYTLDSDVEGALTAGYQPERAGWLPSGVDDALAQRFADAIRAELDKLSALAQTPAIVTFEAVRLPAQSVTRAALPQLSVVSFGDLPFLGKLEWKGMISFPEHTAEPSKSSAGNQERRSDEVTLRDSSSNSKCCSGWSVLGSLRIMAVYEFSSLRVSLLLSLSFSESRYSSTGSLGSRLSSIVHRASGARFFASAGLPARMMMRGVEEASGFWMNSPVNHLLNPSLA